MDASSDALSAVAVDDVIVVDTVALDASSDALSAVAVDAVDVVDVDTNAVDASSECCCC